MDFKDSKNYILRLSLEGRGLLASRIIAVSPVSHCSKLPGDSGFTQQTGTSSTEKPGALGVSKNCGIPVLVPRDLKVM